MVSYDVFTSGKVEKAIARLPADAYQRMNEAIDALADDPRPPGCKRLSNSDAYRIRVGEWRAIYRVDDRARRVEVVRVAHSATSTAPDNPPRSLPLPLDRPSQAPSRQPRASALVFVARSATTSCGRGCPHQSKARMHRTEGGLPTGRRRDVWLVVGWT